MLMTLSQACPDPPSLFRSLFDSFLKSLLDTIKLAVGSTSEEVQQCYARPKSIRSSL